MRIVIHPHAYKHGLSEQQIVSAYETGSHGMRIRQRDRDADPPRWAMIGFDAQAKPIELVVVEGAGDTNIVVHANYLTQGFRDELERSRS